MRATIVLLFVAVAAGLSACGSAQAAMGSVPTQNSSGSVTKQQIGALAEQVFPKPTAGGAYGVCGADGNLSACPYTARLKARLTELRETLARAQNPSLTRVITAELTSPNAGIAHVKLFQGRETLDLSVVRRGQTLLVDDEICTGRKDTSIYAKFVLCDAGPTHA